MPDILITLPQPRDAFGHTLQVAEIERLGVDETKPFVRRVKTSKFRS